MSEITINISDEQSKKLEEIAVWRGISLEDLILRGIEELLIKQETEFQSAIDYVLSKNAELYQRLA